MANTKTNKFGAVKITVDGTKYASKAEARYCEQLKVLERAGHIRNLELQPRFPLIVEGEKVGVYVADAAFFENNARVVVDVKSKPTRTPVYKLKIRLLKALYRGIFFSDVV